MIRNFFAKLVRRTKSQHRCVQDRVVLNPSLATDVFKIKRYWNWFRQSEDESTRDM